MLENRRVTKRVLPQAMDQSVRPVEQYPIELAATLRALSPVAPSETRAVVLTPGPFNSAYFEHTFLARHMGIELVEASDLFVENEMVFVRTTHGPMRVHVIYRRIDDAYLDPKFFRPDSLLGVPGLMSAYAKGRVTLANAPGNGCADDKAVGSRFTTLRELLGDKFTAVELPGEGHSTLTEERSQEAVDAVVEFLGRQLRA